MSNNNSYYLDESSLQSKLKSSEFSFNEDVWLKFENYQTINNKKTSGIEDVVKKTSFTINPNIILPTVFSIIVFSFSMLLFNFVNLKSKPKDKLVVASNLVKPELPKPKLSVLKKAVVTNVIVPKKDSVTINKIISNTPSVEEINLVANPPALKEDKNSKAQSLCIAVESGQIFELPDKASRVIGYVNKNEKHHAIDETLYFIKVAFTSNGRQEFGYIRKGILSKGNDNQINIISKTNLSPHKKKEKKVAENLEPVKAIVTLSLNTEEELDLK